MKWSAYDKLLHQICVGLGWCGSVVDGKRRYVHHYFPQSGPVTADEFVAWVFAADNYDPDQNPDQAERWRQGIRAAFVHHMGGDVVDVTVLN
jgi:hypothetical protein